MLSERQRLRAVRFDLYMDRVDANWRVPARIEQVARWIFVRLGR